MEIYFIRHGQARFGSSNYDRLSDLGKKQATILGDHLAKLDIDFDAAFAGTLERQIDTGHYALDRLPGGAPEIRTDSRFNEHPTAQIIAAQADTLQQENPALVEAFAVAFSEPAQFALIYEAAMHRWMSGEHEIDGLITWRLFVDNTVAAVHNAAASVPDAKRIAIFCSGGTVSAMMQHALGLSGDSALHSVWYIHNGSVSIFRHNKRGLSLYAFNDVSHLRLKNDPALLTYR